MSTPTEAVETIRRAQRGPTGLRAMRSRMPQWAEAIVVVAIVGLVGVTFFKGSLLFLLTTALIYVLFAFGVNILFGWTGISSFGQAAYFGVGAYTVGLLKDIVEHPIALILIGCAIAAVLSTLFALLATRITGVEFAMLTLIFGQILWLITFRVKALRGENGIPGISRGELFGVNLFSDQAFWWYSIAVVGIAVVILAVIRHSSFGAAMNAVRDDPIRAEALGIRVRAVRIGAFALAGGVAGLAGGLFAQQQGLVTPEMLSWVLSGKVIVMCLIGGMFTFWGPAIGALLLVFIEYYLLGATSTPDLFIGIALLVIVLIVPGGLLSLPKTVKEALHRRRSR